MDLLIQKINFIFLLSFKSTVLYLEARVGFRLAVANQLVILCYPDNNNNNNNNNNRNADNNKTKTIKKVEGLKFRFYKTNIFHFLKCLAKIILSTVSLSTMIL